jgi:hypothetical protein
MKKKVGSKIKNLAIPRYPDAYLGAKKLLISSKVWIWKWEVEDNG